MITIGFTFNQSRIALSQLLEARQLMFHLNLISTRLRSKGLSNVRNINKTALIGTNFKSKSDIVSLLRIKLDRKYHNVSKQLYRRAKAGLMYRLMSLTVPKSFKLVKITFNL